VHAGTPVLATSLPEVKRVMEEYQIGAVINECTPVNIAQGVESVMAAGKDAFLPGLLRAQQDFQWQTESKVILDELRNARLIN